MNIKCGVIIYVFIINLILLSAEENKLTVDEILSLIDKNLYSKSQVYTSKMIVMGAVQVEP